MHTKNYIYINFSPLRYNDPIPRPPPIWIPYDMQLKQDFANGKKGTLKVGVILVFCPTPKKKKKKNRISPDGDRVARI